MYTNYSDPTRASPCLLFYPTLILIATIFLTLACFGRIAALDTLLPSFPDLSVQGPQGETALMAACANNEHSAVEKLLEHAHASPDGQGEVFLLDAF